MCAVFTYTYWSYSTYILSPIPHEPIFLKIASASCLAIDHIVFTACSNGFVHKKVAKPWPISNNLPIPKHLQIIQKAGGLPFCREVAKIKPANVPKFIFVVIEAYFTALINNIVRLYIILWKWLLAKGNLPFFCK